MLPQIGGSSAIWNSAGFVVYKNVVIYNELVTSPSPTPTPPFFPFTILVMCYGVRGIFLLFLGKCIELCDKLSEFI